MSTVNEIDVVQTPPSPIEIAAFWKASSNGASGLALSGYRGIYAIHQSTSRALEARLLSQMVAFQ